MLLRLALILPALSVGLLVRGAAIMLRMPSALTRILTHIASGPPLLCLLCCRRRGWPGADEKSGGQCQKPVVECAHGKRLQMMTAMHQDTSRLVKKKPSSMAIDSHASAPCLSTFDFEPGIDGAADGGVEAFTGKDGRQFEASELVANGAFHFGETQLDTVDHSLLKQLRTREEERCVPAEQQPEKPRGVRIALHVVIGRLHVCGGRGDA